MRSEEEYRTPGQLIRGLLEERQWNQGVLADIMSVQQPVISSLVQDKRKIDPEMAIVLGEVFEQPAERFLDLQKTYDLQMARIAVKPDPERALKAQLLGKLPIAEMIGRGWLDAKSSRDIPSVERSLTKFFGVEHVQDIEILPHAAKKTEVSAEVSPAQLAWLYRVNAIASEMLVPRYSPAAVRNALEQLDKLLAAPTEVRHVPRILSEAGIRFVIVESLSSAKIDGACFWLNDMSPVIGVTLRHDRIDNFWFVVRHEIEHVLRGHGRSRVMMDIDLDNADAFAGDEVSEEERVANEAAANFCVPKDAMERFISKKSPYFAERDIIGFAATYNLHPGLVVGQIQHRTRRFDRFRNHLVKVRDFILPSAAVDGWGDVYPLGD